MVLVLKLRLAGRRRIVGGQKRFHFEQKWFTDTSFVTDFLMEWGCLRGENIETRLQKSQTFLTQWAGSRFDHLEKRIKELRKERVELLKKRGCKNAGVRLRTISDELQKLALKEEIHWRQRSRVNWLAHGDRNTQYFHNHASRRRKRNFIEHLRDEAGGEVVYKEAEMAGVVMDYFGNLFQTSDPTEAAIFEITSKLRVRVPESMENMFEEEFTEKEVKVALFQMHPTKAPGPDGFQPVFFQKLWSAVGKDVTKACLRVLNSTGDVEPWNDTNICLIPKMEKPELVRQFRPISLCNTIYKIVSKALVNRLRRWMPHIIDDSQSAFVPGRLISDNILLGYECMHWIRNQTKSNNAFVAAKLDMSKAYDRVEWPFLKMMMETLGFSQKIICLIMRCVETVRYSFVINGRVFGSVKPTRGIRQGDPLSPFLFVICSQGLSTLLKDYMNMQLYAGIKIARTAPMISHIFFADDSLLFFSTAGDGPAKIKKALDLYSQASGQKINFEKSAITFSPGAQTEQKEKVVKEFGVQEVQSHSIYLGLPTFVMRKRKLQFEYLSEKAAKRVGDWMSKTFSTGGKETLIKAVIQSIPTYTMSCFKIPISTCNNLERVCARFWWGDKEKERHMHWMTWKELCKPKSKGGMGFRDLTMFNQALLAKQVWRLVRNPDSLIAKVLKAKYFPEEDVMSTKIKSNCSYVWRSLMWGRELLQKGLVWKIGDGKSVRVFRDAWLPSLPEGKMLRRQREFGDVRVANLMNEAGEWEPNRFSDMMLPMEVEEILKLDKLSHDTPDIRFWSYDPRGEYSVKSGYLVASGYFDAHAKSTSEAMTKWWKFLWSYDLPQRIRIFTWRVFRNHIPSEINLVRHHVPVSGNCGWCRKGWGSTTHALLFCTKVRVWWKKMKIWSIIKKWEGAEIDVIGGVMQAAVSREQFEVWLVGMWLVWKRLCAEKHKELVNSWNDLEQESRTYINVYREARLQAADIQRILPQEGRKVWTRPRVGRFRLDVDYATDEARGRGGIGAIVRDANGVIVFAMAKPVNLSSSILHGELKAMMHGIRQCIEESLSPVEVYSDSMLAVMVVGEEHEEASVLYKDMFEFFAMVKELNILLIAHVRREANKAAHELARLATSLVSTSMWHENWPEWLDCIVKNDIK